MLLLLLLLLLPDPMGGMLLQPGRWLRMGSSWDLQHGRLL